METTELALFWSYTGLSEALKEKHRISLTPKESFQATPDIYRLPDSLKE